MKRTVSEETRRKMSESQRKRWARQHALEEQRRRPIIHLNYGHSAHTADEDETCMYCEEHFAVMAYTYFGAPVCGDCWDNKWRREEDGATDPPFVQIRRSAIGVWR